MSNVSLTQIIIVRVYSNRTGKHLHEQDLALYSKQDDEQV